VGRKKLPRAPVNPVAKALGRGGYTPHIVRSGKAYTRKIKHRNRDSAAGSFFLANQIEAAFFWREPVPYRLSPIRQGGLPTNRRSARSLNPHRP